MAELPIEQIRNDLNMDDLQYEVESLRAERDALREALLLQAERWRGSFDKEEAAFAIAAIERALGQPCERKEIG